MEFAVVIKHIKYKSVFLRTESGLLRALRVGFLGQNPSVSDLSYSHNLFLQTAGYNRNRALELVVGSIHAGSALKERFPATLLQKFHLQVPAVFKVITARFTRIPSKDILDNT